MNWFLEIIHNLFHGIPMDPVKVPESPHESPFPEEVSKYLWNTRENARHSVRVICDEEGLSIGQKNDLCATVSCESGFNPICIHPNLSSDGKLLSTDFGICQINDYWHIGPGKEFKSPEFVLQNPEACIRWMCRMWKAGKGNLWVCYLKGLYKNHLFL